MTEDKYQKAAAQILNLFQGGKALQPEMVTEIKKTLAAKNGEELKRAICETLCKDIWRDASAFYKPKLYAALIRHLPETDFLNFPIKSPRQHLGETILSLLLSYQPNSLAACFQAGAPFDQRTINGMVNLRIGTHMEEVFPYFKDCCAQFITPATQFSHQIFWDTLGCLRDDAESATLASTLLIRALNKRPEIAAGEKDGETPLIAMCRKVGCITWGAQLGTSECMGLSGAALALASHPQTAIGHRDNEGKNALDYLCNPSLSDFYNHGHDRQYRVEITRAVAVKITKHPHFDPDTMSPSQVSLPKLKSLFPKRPSDASILSANLKLLRDENPLGP